MPWTGRGSVAGAVVVSLACSGPSEGAGPSRGSGGSSFSAAGFTSGGTGFAGASSAMGGTTFTGSTGGSATAGGSGGGVSPGGGSGAGGAVGETPPGAPFTVAGNGTIGIEWPRVDGADSYNLYWSLDAQVTSATATPISNAERGYVHRGLTNGQTYYYAVTSVVGGRESSPSAVASASPSGEWVLEKLGTGDFDDVLSGNPIVTVPIEQRVHVLLFGEGYSASDSNQFHEDSNHDGRRDNDVDAWVDQVFGLEPYSLFPEAFVVWYLPRVSEGAIGSDRTAFRVPVDTSGPFAATGDIEGDGETARLAWEAIAQHPFQPIVSDGGGFGRSVRNFVAAFLLFDPARGRASVSGRATSLTNPADPSQRISAAFGVGHHHEFTHSFAGLRDEYLDNGRPAPTTWSETSNVVGTRECAELPWQHLLTGGTINPDVDGLVGAFGTDELGYHSELLCLMNGTHDNGEYFGDAAGGACGMDECTLRVETRMCNFCREITSFRVFERTGALSGSSSFEIWKSDYRQPFYERFEFQVPGIHYEGLLPQSNDRRNPSAGTQIERLCAP